MPVIMSKKSDDRGSTKNAIFALNVGVEIQSNSVKVNVLCCMNIIKETTKLAKIDPLPRMPVNVFDKRRFNKPIITKLIKGKSGTKKMYLDINLIDYFLLTIGCEPTFIKHPNFKNMLLKPFQLWVAYCKHGCKFFG